MTAATRCARARSLPLPLLVVALAHARGCRGFGVHVPPKCADLTAELQARFHMTCVTVKQLGYCSTHPQAKAYCPRSCGACGAAVTKPAGATPPRLASRRRRCCCYTPPL